MIAAAIIDFMAFMMLGVVIGADRLKFITAVSEGVYVLRLTESTESATSTTLCVGHDVHFLDCHSSILSGEAHQRSHDTARILSRNSH